MIYVYLYKSGLGERGSFSITENGKFETISTANVIFIFISDIGAKEMINLLLIYGNYDLIPKNLLKNEVRSILDKQWKRLSYSKNVKGIIPFLPLEKIQIEEIFRLKLQEMGIMNRNHYWLDLIVDYNVVNYLSSYKFINYHNHTITYSNPNFNDLNMNLNTDLNTDIRNTDIHNPDIRINSTITKSKAFATMGK
jgi:hypothetical protein